jgi:hypothetical protein
MAQPVALGAAAPPSDPFSLFAPIPMKDFRTKALILALLAGILLFVPVREADAQVGDDLHLFGFFQGHYRYSSQQGIEGQDNISSFSLQQLNALLMKQFDPRFSAFVNVELTNSFSTDRGWGTLRLEEAWARYNHSPRVGVKAGLLVPTFNNLNEVKNRTPLLPYIFRPLAYETSFAGVFDLENFTPQQGFVQVSGALPLGQARLDYATYAGNNSPEFAAQHTSGSVVSGTDMSTSKMFGGRVGVRWQGITAGVSGTRDQRDISHDLVLLLGQPAEVLASIGLPSQFVIGQMNRTRIGGDLSLQRGNLFAEAEIINVDNGTSAEQNALLATLSAVTESAISPGVDALFYYGLIGYDFTDRFFAYGMYNFLSDEGTNAVLAAGIDMYSVGAGFRPVDGVVSKVQYIYTESRENPLLDFGSHSVYLGISVFF